jgi:hypothetical protein
MLELLQHQQLHLRTTTIRALPHIFWILDNTSQMNSMFNVPRSRFGYLKQVARSCRGKDPVLRLRSNVGDVGTTPAAAAATPYEQQLFEHSHISSG